MADRPRIIAKYWAPGEFPSGASTVLTQTTMRAFTADLRSAGLGRLELPNGAPDQPASGGMVTFDVDDGSGSGPVRALACLCRTMERKTIAPGGFKDQLTTWDMPEHIARFDKGLILPPNGAGFYPSPDTVAFNWTHREFDDSLWTPANLVALVVDAQSDGATPWVNDFLGLAWSDRWEFPINLGTEIIGPDDGTYLDVSDGAADDQNHYFRQSFDVTVAGRHSLFVGADNYAEFWCDGVLLGTTNDWKGVQEIPVDLSVGTHIMGVYLQNLPQASFNPCGYSWSLIRPGYPGTLVTYSKSADTVHVEYQADAPGMAVTQVIRLVVEDLIAAGIAWASDVVLDFTDTEGSDGVTMPIEPNLTAEVGATVLDFIDKIRATYADLWMDPNGWTLHAYEFGTWAPPSGLVLDETNLTALTHRTEDTVADKLLVRSDGLGWTIVGAGGEALGFVSLGSEVAAYDVEAIGQAILDVYGLSRLEIATSYEWSAVTDGIPWKVAPDPADPSQPALVPGALGAAPDLNGDPTEERAISITLTQTKDSENISVEITWKDRIQEFAERVVRELKQ